MKPTTQTANPPFSAAQGGRWDDLVLRFGLFSTAVIGWAGATRLWETGDIIGHGGSLVLMLAIWLACFALIVLSTHERPPKGSVWAIPLVLTLVFLGYCAVDRIHTSINGVPGTTDVVLFMDHAARLILAGENPYQHDLRAAYEVHGAPLVFSTPFLDGDFTGRLAYPALSPLLFVPFVALGLPTNWVYGLFFVLVMAVLFAGSPARFRPIVLLPFFAEPRYILYSLGGVSDIVWATLLCGVVLTWRYTAWRGVLYGLACAFKHQPWLLGPLLLVRVWRETEGDSAAKVRACLLLFAWAMLPFVLVNLPFLLWDPVAWFAGVTEPAAADMITLGQGLSTLSMTGFAVPPKLLYSAYLWGGLGLLTWAYYRHHDRMAEAMWMAPGIALWMGNRSLTSYWYYYAFPMVLGLVWAWERSLAAERDPAPARSDARLTAGVFAVFALAVVGSLAVFAGRPGPFRVAVHPERYATGDRVFRMALDVVNTSDNTLTPRIAVHSWTNQPFFWSNVQGPEELGPGERATYVVQTDVPYETFSARHGARITVADAHSYHDKSTVWIGPSLGQQHLGDVVNGDFRFWAVGPVRPAFWGLQSDPVDAAWIEPARREDLAAGALMGVDRAAEEGAYGVARLDTYLALSHHPVSFEVYVPATANQLPDPDLLYGLDLQTDRHRALVLFGDEDRTGALPDGVPFQMVKVPRETWSTVSLDLIEVFHRLGLDTTPVRHRVHPFTQVDFPIAPLNLRLLLAARGAALPAEAQFGGVHSREFPRDHARRFDEGRAHPERWELWAADFNLEAGNSGTAREHYTRALELAPTLGPAWCGLGMLEERAARWDAAERAWSSCLELGHDVPEAHQGLGWARHHLGDEAGAARAFDEAVTRYGLRHPDDPAIEADALLGLGVARLALGDCGGAGQAFDAGWVLDDRIAIPAEAYDALCVAPLLDADAPPETP